VRGAAHTSAVCILGPDRTCSFPLSRYKDTWVLLNRIGSTHTGRVQQTAALRAVVSRRGNSASAASTCNTLSKIIHAHVEVSTHPRAHGSRGAYGVRRGVARLRGGGSQAGPNGCKPVPSSIQPHARTAVSQTDIRGFLQPKPRVRALAWSSLWPACIAWLHWNARTQPVAAEAGRDSTAST
jgi:hypothetical protein